MGFLLAPVLANLFIRHNEKLWIQNSQGTPPSFYRRYVDDIFSVFDNSFEAKEYFNYIDTRHHNIKFTVENEVNKIIPFLDVLIDNSQNILKTSTYHKSTYSGLLLNYTSFTSRFYKIGLIKCLIDRTYKINNSWPGFHDDVSKIKDVLKRNSYPPFILDKIIKAYINKIHYNNNKVSSEINKLRYFKLPYIDKYSEQVQKKIAKLCKQYCNENNVKRVFISFKISNYFSVKDTTPCFLRSILVYTFATKRCKSCYIGETCGHFITSIDEHIKKDKKSHVFQHLHSKEEYFSRFDLNCFSILYSATTKYQKKFKDGMYIDWEKPNLNKEKNPSVYYFINLIKFYGFFYLSFHLRIYNNQFNRFYNTLSCIIIFNCFHNHCNIF